MIIGKVVGSLFSTRKSEELVGNKFMIVEPVASYSESGTRLVAIDKHLLHQYQCAFLL